VTARKGKKAMTAQQLAALAVQNHVDAIADSLQHHAGGLLPPQTALQLAYNMYVADETTPNPEYLALDERREHLLVRFVLFPLAHTQLRGDGRPLPPATMSRIINIVSRRQKTASAERQPTLAASRIPHRSAVERVHYEADAYEPRTSPPPDERETNLSYTAAEIDDEELRTCRCERQHRCIPPRAHHPARRVHATRAEAHMWRRASDPRDSSTRADWA
jgi:hypothetical protein